MSKKGKIWFTFLGGDPPECPNFIDPYAFAWADKIEQNSPIIKEEILDFLEHHSEFLKPYFNKELMSGKAKWKALSFIFWGNKLRRNCGLCPKTVKIMSHVPGLVNLSISLLEPNTEIPRHRGVTNAVIRAHLGIYVTAGLPDCGICVGDEERGWAENKLLFFNDCNYHHVWNKTNEKRIVLIFDFVLPEFMEKKRSLNFIFGAHLIAEVVMKRLPLLRSAIYFVLTPILKLKK